MARKKSPTLTEAELRLMEILWDKGEGTVNDLVESLSAHQGLAYSTVLTTMRILEQKGYVRHHKEGRAFVYLPVVDRNQARQSAIQFVTSRFFDNSPGLLMLKIMENEEIDPRQLARLKKLIAESE